MLARSSVASTSRVTLDARPVVQTNGGSNASAKVLQVETAVISGVFDTTHVSLPVQTGDRSPSTSPRDGKGRQAENQLEEDDSLEGYGSLDDEQDGRSTGGGGQVEVDEHHDYERDRQRRIRENQLLLNSLGIAPTAIPQTPAASSTRTPSQIHLSSQRKRAQIPVYDRSGYIISLPGPGQRHRMACVEMPSDRGLTKRIAEGEYQDCTDWKYGESRRWRFGRGEGGELAVEEVVMEGGIGKDFRWRKWRGLEKELMREMRKRGELNARDANPQAQPQPQFQMLEEDVSAYSLLPGGSCHQCRRRSEKEKMKCRNTNPPCRAVFCETCCKRYSYFDFDPEARSWICPLCKDCCNCANCIRKRNLAHLLEGKKGIRTKELVQAEREGMTVQAWLEQAIENKVGAPFDRVRLVDQALDVISPELPEEERLVEVKTKKRRKKSAPDAAQPKTKRGKTGKTKSDQEMKKHPENGLVVKLKIPKAPSRKVKEVDSDGDTVGGYSDDEDGSSDSSKLTSLDSSPAQSPVVPRRLAFPPRIADIAGVGSYSTSTSLPSQTQPSLPPPTVHPMSASAETPDATAQPSPTYESIHSVSSDKNSVIVVSSERSGEPRRRRKPPPKANILRAPKHAPIPVSPNPLASAPESATIPDTAHTAQSAHSWQESSAQLTSFQTFSYEGYSNIPPPSLLTQPVPRHLMHSLPPPYSHSPPTHQTPLDETATYLSLPPPAQNLDLLSLAAAEARHSPSVDEHLHPHRHQQQHLQRQQLPHSVPQYTNHRFLQTMVQTSESAWLGHRDDGNVTQGVLGNRRYHQGYP